MSCNFLLIPLTCASALSPDFCFGNTSLMRKAPNEEKIEEAQDCDFAGKSIMFRNLKSTHKKWCILLPSFCCDCFCGSPTVAHFIRNIKEGIRDLRSSPAFIRATGRRLLWIGRNWRTVMDWFRHRSSRGERFPVVELTCWSTNLWGANLTTFFQFNAGWGECFFLLLWSGWIGHWLMDTLYYTIEQVHCI